MLQQHEIRKLVVDRRRECGIGLCGGYDAIVRWLMREHHILTSASWVESVVKADVARRPLPYGNGAPVEDQ